jgi:Ulp1 family protease
VIVGCYNLNSNHWLLWFAKYDQQIGSIFYVNSFPYNENDVLNYMVNWKLFASKRDSLKKITWERMTTFIPFSQTDVYNCGCHVCYNFTCLLEDRNPEPIDMNAYRDNILRVITANSKNFFIVYLFPFFLFKFFLPLVKSVYLVF